MSLPKPKLMVIDDLDSARAMMRRTLARGYEVYDFSSVAEALPAVERADFDALITDLRMPGVDGLAGLKRFKAKVPDLPVILVTAFATVETAIEAMKAGAFDYLTSPSSRSSWSWWWRGPSSTAGSGATTPGCANS